MITSKIELALSFIDKPGEAIELAIVERPVSFSWAIFILANLSSIISGSIVFYQGVSGFWMFFIFILFFNFWVLIATACGFHIVAGLLEKGNGKGDIITLITLLNFSLIPFLFLIPVSLIARFVGMPFYYFLVIIICGWLIYILFVSIKTLYNISNAKTYVVLVSPLIIPFLVALVFFVISIGSIYSVLI
ncbi:MAG: hypothetical protein AB1349_11345 [Elusimicrobiota bacterium]